MRNAEAANPGTRIKIAHWPFDPRMVGATGTVTERGCYIRVKLDECNMRWSNADVLCLLSELELIGE